MRCLGRLVGCLLLGLVAMLAPLTIWTVLLWGDLSNADRYTDSLSDQAYEDLSLLVLPGVAQLASGAAYERNEDEAGDALNIFSQMIVNLDIERWRAIIGDQIDPAWVKETLKTNLDNIFTYWRFETDAFVIQANMRPIAEILPAETGEAITAGVMAETRNLDDCNASQLTTLETTLDGGGTANAIVVPRCDPGEVYLAELEVRFELARRQLISDLNNLPDYQFDLESEVTDTPSEVDQFKRDIHDIRRVLFLIDRTVVVLLLLPVMLMSLVVVITVRSAKGFFLWTSLALIETALLTLLPLMPYIYNLIINPQRAVFSGSSNTEFVLGFEMVGLFFSSFAPTILVAVAVMAFVGIGFLILAALLKAPQRRAQQPVYYVMPSNTMAVSGMTPMPSQPVTPYGPPMGMMGPAPMQLPQPLPPPMSPVPPPGSQSGPRTPPPNKRDTGSESVLPSPIMPSVAPPLPPTTPPMQSSAAERYREQLSDPNLPEDRTFIPIENHDTDKDE